MTAIIPTAIVPSVAPAATAPAAVAREFRNLLGGGATLRVAGQAKGDPQSLFRRGYTPKYRIDLFSTRFYLTDIRQNPDLRFFIAYVVPDAAARATPVVYPRIFYKDVSLVWRAASHYVNCEEELWIGKGDIGSTVVGGDELTYSVESTCDLPLEIQSALDTLSRKAKPRRKDYAALDLVLRKAPPSRIIAYRDFIEPRRRAAAVRGNLINGGRKVAVFRRRNDPASLSFVKGYGPDFAAGIVETATTTSKLYGGVIGKARVLSRNRRIQYLFLAGPRHVWIVPPQALTTELSSYGVRTIDVVADEDLFVPGFEFHYMEDGLDPPELVSQIPEGYAGKPSPLDEDRADASAWLDRLPVVQEFRAKVLSKARGRRG